MSDKPISRSPTSFVIVLILFFFMTAVVATCQGYLHGDILLSPWLHSRGSRLLPNLSNGWRARICITMQLWVKVGRLKILLKRIPIHESSKREYVGCHRKTQFDVRHHYVDISVYFHIFP